MSNFQDDIYPDRATEQIKCREFLQDFIAADGTRPYVEILKLIADRAATVLEINLNDVSEHVRDDEFLRNISLNTIRYIRMFEEAADALLPEERVSDDDVIDVLKSQRVENGGQAGDIPKRLTRRFEVTVVPTRSTKPRKLREVKASDIGHLVAVKGMVTRVTDVKPMVTVVTYTCEVCGSEIYQEITGNQFMPVTKCPSDRCKDDKVTGRLHMQTRGSRFVKYQELRVQELPDQVPVGHIPRSLTVQCRGEQTRQCGPGDVITVAGVFLTVRFSGFRAIKAGLLADTYLEATHIEKNKLGYEQIQDDEVAKRKVEDLARDPEPYTKLAGSIAPEIYGHEDVKKALLLQLVGGSSRVLPDGMRIRGDINICLMGDPGVAKSQLLKYIAATAPRGVYTTGKGSSGVGLTASVVRDTMTGDLSLEGGALVLADKGICCIDEFDKMEDGDRTAIHEVMEQQTISIAKAGITTTLNARTAVLAAANPLFGRYNKRRSISENVNLPNSLLSRFDLLFLMLDKSDMETDLALSRHVLYVHKHVKTPQTAFRPVEPATIKQFIAAARQLQPLVPRELTSYIVEAYVALRMQEAPGVRGKFTKSGVNDQAVMTPRQLLSMLRLSQALARLRLAGEVSNEDVDEAIRLTHASKASLFDDGPSVQQEDAVSAVFSIVRDFAAQQKTDMIDYAQVEAMTLKKGFTTAQLQQCLQEYQTLGIIHVAQDMSFISFDA
jgi:DNA replication licensing factor MCM7